MFDKKPDLKLINNPKKVRVIFGKEQEKMLCINGTNLFYEGNYISVLNEDGERVAYIKASDVTACWIDEGDE